MFFLNIVLYILLLGAWTNTNTFVSANGTLCNGTDCLLSPVPNCPHNGVFSEQENGCIVTESLIRSCPEGFKLSTGATQCSKNIHTDKVLTCPENTRYNKHTQSCYIESKEIPKCETGYIEDGNGDCYKLKEAEMSCGANEEERGDGCYTQKLVKKEYNCHEIPLSIRAIHEHDDSSYTSNVAFLEGEKEYDNGSKSPICKVKVFHKPICPEGTTEDGKGSCIQKSRPEIFCPEGYVLNDVKRDASIQGTYPTLESRHYCQKEEFVEPNSECPIGMVKEKDGSGIDVCYLIKEEIPQQCQIGFTYFESIRKCIRKESATPRCNDGYIYKGGFCYLSERKVIEINPVSYCMDPDAVIVGQYCVKNQSMAPNVDCPAGYIFDQVDNKCNKEIEIDPIVTCPPRFVLNSQSQVCERKIERDCSITQYKKKCTSYDSETGTDINREVVLETRNLNMMLNHGNHHHGGHHHNYIVPRESTKIVHQCVEIPEYIPKMCVNVETSPVVYVCHNGIQSTDQKKCIKISTVMPNYSCPTEYKLRNGRCEQQNIEPIFYKCLEGYLLSENSVTKIPKCIAEGEEIPREKKINAFFECPDNFDLRTNEFNQFECIEAKNPVCKSENCKSIVKISGPEWKCPIGTEILNEDDLFMARAQNRRMLVSNHHYGTHHITKRVSNIMEKPKCIVKVTHTIEKRCLDNNSTLMGDYCFETIEKSCPTEGCESYLEFKPNLECPEKTESLGIHKADMCMETIKKPFKYHCLPGGKITQHNKCRYITKKNCKHLNCKELIPTEGKMQCPPGYSEVKNVSNYSNNNSFLNMDQQGLLPTNNFYQENNSLHMTRFAGISGFGQRRRLFGSVRPLSNISQCAALEFAPFILSCPEGFTQSEGKCVGVIDPSYQCPNGTYMRQDGLCGKSNQIDYSGNIINGDVSNLQYQNQIQYTRKNKF